MMGLTEREELEAVRASHARLLKAAKEVVRTFPLPLYLLVQAKETLEAAIAAAEEVE